MKEDGDKINKNKIVDRMRKVDYIKTRLRSLLRYNIWQNNKRFPD